MKTAGNRKVKAVQPFLIIPINLASLVNATSRIEKRPSSHFPDDVLHRIGGAPRDGYISPSHSFPSPKTPQPYSIPSVTRPCLPSNHLNSIGLTAIMEDERSLLSAPVRHHLDKLIISFSFVASASENKGRPPPKTRYRKF